MVFSLTDWDSSFFGTFIDRTAFEAPVSHTRTSTSSVELKSHTTTNSTILEAETPLPLKYTAPDGTIYMYSDNSPLQLVAYQDAKRVHMLVRKSVALEFDLADKYMWKWDGQIKDTRLEANLSPSPSSHVDLKPPNPKKRRNPATLCEWKPESVFKTFVDSKPPFFDKTDYQDRIPKTSCFGKINMRVPKAWSRGPNRPKRSRNQKASEPHQFTEQFTEHYTEHFNEQYPQEQFHPIATTHQNQTFQQNQPLPLQPPHQVNYPGQAPPFFDESQFPMDLFFTPNHSFFPPRD